jgi:hypothetical protein
LIITRAGKDSLHRKWLLPDEGQANFDLLVAAYHPDAMGRDSNGVRHIEISGTKVSGWQRLFAEHPELLDRYQYIALIDDDIEVTTEILNRCFAAGEKHNLSIWQPALSPDSYVTYAASLANPMLKLRYVNYVEMMCPFFSTEVLRACLPLFSLGLESGIDLIWCSIANEMNGKCAVIDEAIVRHTRPVGGMKAANGFVDRNYETDIYKCLDIFDMRWPSSVATGAVSKGGKTITSKLALTLLAAYSLCTVPTAPEGRLRRLRTATDHLRHQLTRPAYYGDRVIEKVKSLP